MLQKKVLLQWRQNYCMLYKLYPRLLHHICHESLVEWVYDQNTEDGKYFLPWFRHILSISLNLGRWIGIETIKVDNVSPPDELFFGSDT